MSAYSRVCSCITVWFHLNEMEPGLVPFSSKKNPRFTCNSGYSVGKQAFDAQMKLYAAIFAHELATGSHELIILQCCLPPSTQPLGQHVQHPFSVLLSLTITLISQNYLEAQAVLPHCSKRQREQKNTSSA